MNAPQEPSKQPEPSGDSESREASEAPSADEMIEQAIARDEAELSDGSARALEPDAPEGGEILGAGRAASAAPEAASPRTVGIEHEGESDWEGAPSEPADAAVVEAEVEPDWANETSSRRLIIELRAVETQVRQILESKDPKRKRKLTGTRRWRELEEDIISWRYVGRFDESTLDNLHRLVQRRHFLFTRLRFLAGTRPTWNT